jgi:hypothetical protein
MKAVLRGYLRLFVVVATAETEEQDGAPMPGSSRRKMAMPLSAMA